MPNNPKTAQVTLTTDEAALLDQLLRGLLMRKSPEVFLGKRAFASLYNKVVELRKRLGQ